MKAAFTVGLTFVALSVASLNPKGQYPEGKGVLPAELTLVALPGALLEPKGILTAAVSIDLRAVLVLPVVDPPP